MIFYRIDELNRRISALQDEKQRLKNEITPLRAMAKDQEAEIKILKRKLEEKGQYKSWRNQRYFLN